MNSRIGKYFSSMLVGARRGLRPDRRRALRPDPGPVGTVAGRGCPYRASCSSPHGTPARATLPIWCRRGDSNSHGFRHRPLKTACLPISPRRRDVRSSACRILPDIPPPASRAGCSVLRPLLRDLARLRPAAGAGAPGAGLAGSVGGTTLSGGSGGTRRPSARLGGGNLSITPAVPSRRRRPLRGAGEIREPQAGRRRTPSPAPPSCATGNSPTRRRRTGCPTSRCRRPRPCPRPCRAGAAPGR